MLGKVFKKDGINLIYGESGSGKTVSTIKALNEDGIIPILLDFDNNLNPDKLGIKYIHIDGLKAMSALTENAATAISDSVIIIDTWQLFVTNGYGIADAKKLQQHNNTIIIIAHNKDIATKTDIPDMDPKIVNHLDSKLYLEYDKGSTTKTNPRPEGYNLVVKKLRGYQGSRTIQSWMREPSKIDKLIK